MSRSTAVLLATLALLGVAGCASGQQPSASSSRDRAGSAAPSRAPSPRAARATGAAGPASRTGPPQVFVAGTSWRLPQAMSRGVAIPVPGGAVLAGGLLPRDVSTAGTYRLALPEGRWRRLPPLPTPAHDAAGAMLDGRPAVFGGGAATELSGVQALGSDGSWHEVGRLPGPRSDLSAVTRDRRVVLVGGYDGLQMPRTVLESGDGRSFTTLGSLPRGVRYAAVAVVGRTAWVLGGEADGRELRMVYAVDLGSGQVRVAGRLPRALGHEAAVVAGDRILLMGGRTSPHRTTRAMWWFEPSTGAWRRAGRLPYPVADAPTVVSGSTAYLLGGETPDFTDRVTEVSWR